MKMNETPENCSTTRDETEPSLEKHLKEYTKSTEYEVEHGLFKWSIENISHFPSREDKYCRSPVFALKKTWWSLALHPNAKICGVNKISLNLIRQRSDLGPNRVIASYRLGLENAENKIWFKAKENKYFGKGDCFGFQTSLFGHLQDFLSGDDGDNHDTIAILCEIYVKCELVTSKAVSDLTESNVNLSLSDDLKNIYVTQKYCDILIEIPKIHFRAHKFLLCARSITLARMLEDGKSFIQLSCTRSCLNCVFLYMYSGNFDFVVKHAIFSIGLYELACELSLNKLRDFLTPHKIELKSRIIKEICSVSCTLDNFCLENITKKRYSGTHTDNKMGMKIMFYFRKTSLSSNLVECIVNVATVWKPLDGKITGCLLNKNFKPFRVITPRSLARLRNSICSISLTFSDEDIVSCLCNDKLSIYFEYRQCTVTRFSNTTESQMQVAVKDNTWLEELSTDLETFYRSGKLSDLTVITMGERFKLHRSMLAARCKYFSKIINFDGVKSKITKYVDTDPYIFDLMCIYVYSGRLPDMEHLSQEELLDLYEVAEDYELEALVDECVDYLQASFDPDFVYKAMDMASKYQNKNLEHVCVNYISECGLEEESEVSMVYDLKKKK